MSYKYNQRMGVYTGVESFPAATQKAIQRLIDAAVKREREECARLAEDWAEPATPYGRGHDFAADEGGHKKKICFAIAEHIRRRK